MKIGHKVAMVIYNIKVIKYQIKVYLDINLWIVIFMHTRLAFADQVTCAQYKAQVAKSP